MSANGLEHGKLRFDNRISPMYKFMFIFFRNILYFLI